MSSTDVTYRIAAREHLVRAQEAYESRSYYLSHYLAGLAVECHLRAWLRRKTDQFDSRHDLSILAKESLFYDVIPSKRLSHFSYIMATVNLRWRSNHRYYSERQFFQYLTKIRVESKTWGDNWKQTVARALLDCAYEVVNEGEAQWNKK